MGWIRTAKYGSRKITDTLLHSVEGNVIEILEDAVFTSIGEFGIADSLALHGISSTQSAGEEIFAKTKFTGVQLASGSVRVGGRVRSCATPSFLPTDESGSSLWLRSDLGVTLNGSDVSYWADQSDAGYDFEQLTAVDQPEYVLNQLNGHPVITFDGVTEFLAGVSGDLNESTWHIFFVTDNQQYVLGRDTSNKDYLGFIGNTLLQFRSDVGILSFYFDSLVGYRLCEVTIVESGNMNAWMNGVASAENPQAASAIEFDAVGVYRGSIAFDAGSIAEVIIYDNIKTGASLTNIRNYLNNRYSLYV